MVHVPIFKGPGAEGETRCEESEEQPTPYLKALERSKSEEVPRQILLTVNFMLQLPLKQNIKL